AVADIPSSEEHKPRPFEVWRANWLKFPALIHDAYFVAVKDGVPVGLANLNRASEERVFNGFTGVARSARGLGIARALKLKTIEWSKANGIKSIDTGNDMSNEHMLSINIPLGYLALPARFEYMRLMN
ncbi:MAG TPA: GNAT family N-acetyltransferase, partial [Chloroflexota bacterium]|nr:GNAT family N-acetyltransferase [Chloroflexota bacterium]